MRVVEVVGFRMQREQLLGLGNTCRKKGESFVLLRLGSGICLLANSTIASAGQQLETTIAISEEKGHLSSAADCDLSFFGSRLL